MDQQNAAMMEYLALQFGVTGGKRPELIQCQVIKEKEIKHSFEISTFLFFALPMTVITVLYALIGLRLRRSALLKKSSGSFSHHQETTRSACRSASSRRVLKMLVAVVVAFFICWAPFHAQRLVAIYGVGSGQEPISPMVLHVYVVVTYLSGILYYVSTTVNPILYHIMSLKFREAFKDSLSRCCCGAAGRRSYSVLSRQQRTLGRLGSKSVTATDSQSAPSNSDRGDSSLKAQKTDSSYISPDIMETRLGASEREPKMPCISCLHHQASTDHYAITEKRTDANHCYQPNEITDQHNSKYQHNNISNSSLKDVDHEELQKELALYMRDVSKRYQNR